MMEIYRYVFLRPRIRFFGTNGRNLELKWLRSEAKKKVGIVLIQVLASVAESQALK